ncbi:MAG: hypothetical protein MJ179_02625 [Treponema sp.]|nr:hypothetical protein [Treponema sp.]
MENKELEKVTESRNALVIGGKERIIRFGFSAWAKLEEKYGSIQNIEKLEKEMEEKPMTELRELAWIGLTDKEVYNSEGKRTGKQLDKETFLDEFSLADIEQVTSVVMGALYGALPKTEEDNNESKESV